VLYTDGLTDHRDAQGGKYFPVRLESVLRANKTRPAREIFERIKADMLAFNPKPDDDITVVVIKKT